jgi:hypothetical protein
MSRNKRVKASGYKNIVSREGYSNVKKYVETGTHRGIQLAIADSSNCFDKIFGIEIDEIYYRFTLDHVLAHNKDSAVVPIHGDTGEWLPKLSDLLDEPTFFYLDAHFCNAKPRLKKREFPLWKELDILKARSHNDIVAVDDVHAFGNTYQKLKVDESVEEWEGVTAESLLEYMGDIVEHHQIVGDAFVMWISRER